MNYENYIFTKKDSVGLVKLNRPDKANALTIAAFKELRDLLRSVREDPDVNAILVYGAGKHFCAGNDIDLRREARLSSDISPYESQWEDWQCRHDCDMEIRDYPKPIIAAVHGACMGAAVEMITLFDAVFAAEDAKFGIPEMRMSMVPYCRMVYAFSHIRFAKETIGSGENFSAHRAFQIGMINRVVPPEKLMDEAMTYARRLALMPPENMSMMKKELNAAEDLMGFREMMKMCLSSTLHSVLSDSNVKRTFSEIGNTLGTNAALKWQREYFAQAEKPFEE